VYVYIYLYIHTLYTSKYILVLECLDIVLEDKTKIWREKNHAAKKDKKLKESFKKHGNKFKHKSLNINRNILYKIKTKLNMKKQS